MAKKVTAKKKKSAPKKKKVVPVKKKAAAKKSPKAVAKPKKKAPARKKKSNTIPFKVQFGNITLTGNAQPTAVAQPGMAFPSSYQLTFTGKNKNLIGANQGPVGFIFVNGFWNFQGIPPQVQQQSAIQQMESDIGNAIMKFYQKQ